MTAFQRQGLFWLAVLLVTLVLLYAFSSILLPFVAGAGLAYLLDPLANRLQRLGLSRTWATIVILLVMALLTGLALVAVVPLLIAQLGQFLGNVPTYVDALQRLVRPVLNSRAAQALGIDPASMEGDFSGIAGNAAGWLSGVVASIWTSSQAVLNVLSLLIVTPVVTFYLLLDWHRMLARINELLPPRHAPAIRHLATEMGAVIGAFVRGQALVCLILGLFYALGLALVGLKYGLVIGLGAGLISFIPYVGSALGFIVSIGVAIAQFWPDWVWILATAAVFFVGQFIEGNILQPKMVGDRVGLHAVWVMFALLAFGVMFGLLGLLVAVPVAAAIAVLVRFALARYVESEFYRGTAPRTAILVPQEPPVTPPVAPPVAPVPAPEPPGPR